MDEIIRWSAARTAQALRTGEVAVREVTAAHLARIEACEPGLRALVEPFSDAAMAQAQAMDAARPADPPPLWGLPVSVKINVDMAGHPNSNGIPALNDTPCERDAPVVTNLKKAGSVIIGRTSTPEFSLRFFTSNPIYGRTLNPLDPAVTSGGSSGGASSAVAAGMGVLGHGNDLGGSLRYPAYCCGLATLRPSLGKVPAFNPSAAERPAMLQAMSVQGVIARTVGDVRLAMGPLSARSVLDPQWNGAAASGGARHGRVGVCADPFGDGVHGDVARAVQIAADAARQAGLEVIDMSPPMTHEAAETWGLLLNAEAEISMGDFIRENGSAEINAVVRGYQDIFGMPDLTQFVEQQARRLTIQRAWAQMFDDIDALILPVSARPPFAADQDFVAPDTLPQIMQAQRPLYIINLLGLPAATLRTGPGDTVPLGVQVASAWRNDDLCLDVAEAIERELALDLRPIEPH